MTRVAIEIVALALAVGCIGQSEGSPGNPPQSKEKLVSEPALTWSLSKAPDGKSLSLSFEVKNTTVRPLYVADRLVKAVANGKFRREDRLVIMNGDEPHTIRFIVGAVSADEPSTVVYEPTYAAVAPRETLRRRVSVPLPLATYNPVGATLPISAKADHAILFVHIIEGEPATWTTQVAEDGTQFKVPDPTNRRVLRGTPLPLPR